MSNSQPGEPDFHNGSEVQHVIVDKKNVCGQYWLYVNKHPNNQKLLKVLMRWAAPYATYLKSTKSIDMKNNRGPIFGYEWVFLKPNKVINKLKAHGFKLKPGENANRIK